MRRPIFNSSHPSLVRAAGDPNSGEDPEDMVLDGAELKQKRGAATVLALLVSLLFSYAPAAAQVESDRTARLGPTELVKRAALVRASVRAEADDEDPVLLPPQPRVHTETTTIRPAGTFQPVQISSAARSAPRAYRARAPPAA